MMNSILLSFILMLLVLLSSTHASAESYKWTDQWGDIHFTDDRTKIPSGARVKVMGQGSSNLSLVNNPHKNLNNLAAEIPYSMVNNSMIIQASVNGVAMRMILDTGASFVVIPPAIASRAGIVTEGKKKTKLATANGKVSAPQVFIDYLKVGSFSEEKIPAVVKNILKEDPRLGLLGMSFLERFKFQIDQDRSLLLLLEKR